VEHSCEKEGCIVAVGENMVALPAPRKKRPAIKAGLWFKLEFIVFGEWFGADGQ
jgi:hypothetical protein